MKKQGLLLKFALVFLVFSAVTLTTSAIATYLFQLDDLREFPFLLIHHGPEGPRSPFPRGEGLMVLRRYEVLNIDLPRLFTRYLQ